MTIDWLKVIKINEMKRQFVLRENEENNEHKHTHYMKLMKID